MDATNSTENFLPKIKRSLRGISITLCENGIPLRNWFFSESIFNERISMNFNEPGNMRSPIDITGMTLKRYPPLCESNDPSLCSGYWDGRVKVQVNPGSYYKLKIEEVGKTMLFRRPQLCYIVLNYLGNNNINGPKFIRRFKKLINTKDTTSRSSITPSGEIFIYPNQPSKKEGLNLLQEISFSLNSVGNQNFYFNYDFVFCVYPTLFAALRYYSDRVYDFSDLNNDNSIRPLTLNEVSSLIKRFKPWIIGKEYHQERKHRLINRINKLRPLIRQADLRELLNAYLNDSQQNNSGNYPSYEKSDLRKLLQRIVSRPPSENALSRCRRVLRNLLRFTRSHYINMPIHFLIDPIAKVSSSSTRE